MCRSLWFFLVFFGFFSCENPPEKNSTKKKFFPSQTLYNTSVIQRDSGNIILSLKAPVIEKYEYIDSPYTEVKKGFYLEYFDKKNPKIPGKVWAGYAILYDKKNLYHAKNHVKIRTSEGTTFTTKSIFWDKNTNRMYTKDTVYVEDKDGNHLVGTNGMEADDHFMEYKFYNNRGSFLPDKVGE
ncbi:MAG: LPS export ABC transporter periplasmic protein LptC [Bergeyella sp.]|nr:LPS export ABC transporter periplasmic protein LptC [Bergeyella sp.]